jgi:hypothetical protein
MNVSFSFHLKHKNRNLAAIQRQSVQKLCLIHAKKRKKLIQADKRLNHLKKDACIFLDVIYDDNQIRTENNPMICPGYMSVAKPSL